MSSIPQISLFEFMKFEDLNELQELKCLFRYPSINKHALLYSAHPFETCQAKFQLPTLKR
jgi:hypothetical protein